MGIEENKEVVQGYIEEIVNKKQYDKWEQYMSDEFSGNKGAIATKEDHLQYWDGHRSNMPDLQVEITDIMAEGDRVITIQKWSGHASADGAYRSAEGKYGECTHANLYELKDGKIISGGVLVSGALALLQQYEIIPSMEELAQKLTK